MDKTVIQLITIALGVITDRLLTIISLAMTFGLATWIMWNPSWERFATFAFFAIAVFLPCIFKERKNEHISKGRSEERDDL
jgi:hypothetical protein